MCFTYLHMYFAILKYFSHSQSIGIYLKFVIRLETKMKEEKIYFRIYLLRLT